MKYCAKIC